MGIRNSKEYPPPNPGETCKNYVARVCGTDYYLINPFIDNLSGWSTAMGSTSPFPREGANDQFHMDMVKGLCLGDRQAFPWYSADPQWDKEYMRQGGENWLLVAPFWHEVKERGDTKDAKNNDSKEEGQTKKKIRKIVLPKLRKVKKTKEPPTFTPEQLHAIEAKVTRPPMVSSGVPDAPPVYCPLYPVLPQAIAQARDEELMQIAALALTPQAPAPAQAQAQVPSSAPVLSGIKGSQEVSSGEMVLVPKAALDKLMEDASATKEQVSKSQPYASVEGPRPAKMQAIEKMEIYKAKPSKVKSRPESPAEEDDTDVGKSSQASGQYPYLIMGDQMILKPLDFGELTDIIAKAPKPQVNPTACINFLKRACKGRQYTQDDMKLLIEGLLNYDNESAWKWENVPTISNVQPPGTAASEYRLNTEEGQTAMWKELEDEMKKVFSDRSSLPTAVACKQKGKEEVVEFLKRFTKVWKEEAGLSTEGPMGKLFVQTFINGLKHEFGLMVKQMVSDWPSSDVKTFTTKVIEKDAAGCFDVKGVAPLLYQEGLQKCNPMQARPQGNNRGGKRWGGSGRGRLPPSRQGGQDEGTRRTHCFNCGQEGHWKNQCPYPPKTANHPQFQQAQNTQGPPSQAAVRYPLPWNQQQYQA